MMLRGHLFQCWTFSFCFRFENKSGNLSVFVLNNKKQIKIMNPAFSSFSIIISLILRRTLANLQHTQQLFCVISPFFFSLSITGNIF